MPIVEGTRLNDGSDKIESKFRDRDDSNFCFCKFTLSVDTCFSNYESTWIVENFFSVKLLKAPYDNVFKSIFGSRLLIVGIVIYWLVSNVEFFDDSLLLFLGNLLSFIVTFFRFIRLFSCFIKGLIFLFISSSKDPSSCPSVAWPHYSRSLFV